MKAVLTLAELESFDPHPQREGAERRYCCPLPDCEGKPRDAGHRSFAANTDSGLWHCWRCGAKGKLADSGPPPTPRDRRTESRRQLRRAFSLSPEPTLAEIREQRAQLHALLPGLVKLMGTPAESYLARRGIPLALASAARVRFAPDWLGRPAVVFPLRDQAGELVAAEGRYLDDGQPKTRCAGSKVLGVFATPGAWEAPVALLVEGPVDALSLAAVGVPAIATMGASNRPAWLPGALAFRPVLLGFDADAAGDREAPRLAAALRALGARVERLRPREGSDWNDLLTHDPDSLRDALAALTPAPALAPPGPDQGDVITLISATTAPALESAVPVMEDSDGPDPEEFVCRHCGAGLPERLTVDEGGWCCLDAGACANRVSAMARWRSGRR